MSAVSPRPPRLAARFPHPRDKQIKFEAASHKYFVNEKPVPTSVTSFIGRFFDPFAPVATATKYLPSWKTNPTSKYYEFIYAISDCGDETLIKLITTGWRLKGQRAARLGQLMHSAIEHALELDDEGGHALELDDEGGHALELDDEGGHALELDDEGERESEITVSPPQLSTPLASVIKSTFFDGDDDDTLTADAVLTMLKLVNPAHLSSATTTPPPPSTQRLLTPHAIIKEEMVAWRQWWKTRRDEIEPVRVEWSIFFSPSSPRSTANISLAGQVDAVFRSRKNPSEFILFDWKRTNACLAGDGGDEVHQRAARYPFHNHLSDNQFGKYSLQTNIYAYILRKCYGLNVTQIRLLQIIPAASATTIKEIEVAILPEELISNALLPHRLSETTPQ